MFSLNNVQNSWHRRYYEYAVFGFAGLTIGYLLRGRVHLTNDLVNLLLGIFPNLLGSFATPFLLQFLILRRFPSQKSLDRAWVFVLINLFTFAVCLLIEYLHVAFELGAWDANDIAASAAGGIAALALYLLPRVPRQKTFAR